MSNIELSNISPEQKINVLEKENKKLKKKIDRLKKTMDITTRYSDVVTGKLEEQVEASIKEIETHIHIIGETIPVPVIISSTIISGKILYVNKHTCRVFGMSYSELLKRNASDLYENPHERQMFLKNLSTKGQVSEFEVRMKRRDNSLLWAALFSNPLNFKNQPCVLTVIYDLTDRRKAEDEIRRLRQELDQKVIRYLIFTLNEEEYGLELLKVKEIISIMPVTPVLDGPSYLKGMINLRDRVIPVMDIRLKMNMEPAKYTDLTCIVIIKNTENNDVETGIIVDAVTDIQEIKAKDIEPVPSLAGIGSGIISGLARSKTGLKILINTDCFN